MEKAIRVKLLHTGNDNDYLKLEVDYDKGGENYFTDHIRKRGIRLYVRPVKIEEHEGFNGGKYTTERSIILGTTMETGYYVMLLEQKRRNQKKEEKFREAIYPHAEHIRDLFELQHHAELRDYVVSLCEGIK